MKSTDKKFPKKYFIWGLILAFLFFAVLLPILWPDASTRYTGVKKEAAEYTVKHAWQVASGINYASVAGTIKISAESVSLDDPNNKMCNGEFMSKTEPEGGDRFLVTVNYRTLFGVQIDTTTFHICRSL
jgi:hypothetical protein